MNGMTVPRIVGIQVSARRHEETVSPRGLIRPDRQTNWGFRIVANGPRRRWGTLPQHDEGQSSPALSERGMPAVEP